MHLTSPPPPQALLALLPNAFPPPAREGEDDDLPCPSPCGSKDGRAAKPPLGGFVRFVRGRSPEWGRGSVPYLPPRIILILRERSLPACGRRLCARS